VFDGDFIFMTDERDPTDVVQELVDERQTWSDDEILAELSSLPALPPEYLYLEGDWYGPDNPAWDDPKILKQMDIYLASAKLVEERKIKRGVLLLLERASYGDFGETMRGLRHYLERAYDPDWTALADVCIEAAKSAQPGSRLWAIHLLGYLNHSVLKEVRGLPILLEALYDPAKLVRFHACTALGWLGQARPEYKQEISKVLERLVVESKETAQHADEAWIAINV
jgi:hypothetical protein